VTHTGCLLATSDKEMGKIGPSPLTSTPARKDRAPGPWVAGQIGPYFILALDGGPATAFGLGFVSTPATKTCRRGPRFWPDFPSQRRPRGIR
jgi:hypothetical protein